jgi:hypothetical protein
MRFSEHGKATLEVAHANVIIFHYENAQLQMTRNSVHRVCRLSESSDLPIMPKEQLNNPIVVSTWSRGARK